MEQKEVKFFSIEWFHESIDYNKLVVFFNAKYLYIIRNKYFYRILIKNLVNIIILLNTNRSFRAP